MVISYPINGDNTVEMVRYTLQDQNTGKGLVWINQIQYFEGVPFNVWKFCLGGSQVYQHWLKARQDCSLSNEETQQYQRIVMVLKEIIELMVEIDASIQYSQLKKQKIFE
jgi:hypothetical protein